MGGWETYAKLGRVAHVEPLDGTLDQLRSSVQCLRNRDGEVRLCEVLVRLERCGVAAVS